MSAASHLERHPELAKRVAPLVPEGLTAQEAAAGFRNWGQFVAALREQAELEDALRLLEWDQATYNSYFHRIKDATDLTIPKLNEMAYEQVEVSSVPFLKFVANKGINDDAANYSFVLRGYVRHWLANVW
ncbi:MAG: hypothetical protein K6T59_02015, partial [Bryobacteraceae bacterium]|nr:hypothetical protein [Bryobacteraceae bacterium]